MNNPIISLQLANDTINTRIDQAERSRIARRAPRERQEVERADVRLRAAHPCDANALGRLAELDSAPVPGGELLLGFVDGTLVAAVGSGGDAIADPFAPTADLVELMRRRVRSERRPLRRLVTAGAVRRVGGLAR